MHPEAILSRFRRALTAPMAAILAFAASASHAEDIDLYSIQASSSGARPNVIIVLENSANWTRSDQGWPGGIKQGHAELKAIRQVVSELDEKVNVGLMMFTSKTGSGETPVAERHDGGYVRFHLRPMNATNRSALMNLVGTPGCVPGAMNAVNGTPDCIYGNIETPEEKVNVSSADYSAMLFEVFKYLGGYTSPVNAITGLAGSPIDKSHFGPLRFAGRPEPRLDPYAYSADANRTSYNSPITDAASCGKTYVIFIGNGFPQAETGYPSTQGPETLLAGVGGDTTQLRLPTVTQTVTTTSTLLTTTACGQYNTCSAALSGQSGLFPDYSSFTCSQLTSCATGGQKRHQISGLSTGASVTPTGTTYLPNAAKTRYADEWARFLYKTDVSPAPGQQNVITYSIDVFKDNPDAEQAPLLMSMAQAGGGKYFAATNENAIVSALRKIFAEVQSVNSVFASTSLPMSANTQGTYLNQIFVGMFRPDAQSRPRWMGNLKQYEFRLFGSELRLSDRNGERAINPNSGFIAPCADSFWTQDTGAYWDYPGSVSGGTCTSQTSQFPTVGSSARFSDAPDGDVVEKGGVAGKLRGAGPDGTGGVTLSTANYATRSIFTCNPTTCSTLRDFDDANTTDVTQAALGATSAAERTNLIDWVRGKDVNNENGNSSSSGAVIVNEVRPSVHGDIVHSQPAVVDYGGSTGVVAFYGANAGMLHAVRAGKADTDGGELWGFVAPETFGRLKRLMDNDVLINLPGIPTTITPTPRAKDYFFDGSVGLHTSTDRRTVWIFPTMRRGGRAIYALDVSNPASPVLKWRIGCFTASTADDSNCASGWTSIGQTWSKPQVGYLNGYNDSGGARKPVLVFGGGYDTCEDTDSQTRCTGGRKGASIWIVDADTGTIIRTYPTHYSVPGDIALVSDSAGALKYLYATDSGGHAYRVNVGRYNGATFSAAGEIDWSADSTPASTLIASLSEPGHARKFLNGPDVVPYVGFNAVMVGSGDREHPLKTSYHCNDFSGTAGASVLNRFYMLKDRPNGHPATPVGNADLTDVTTALTADESSVGANGWRFDLNPCEQVVNRALTIGGTVHFGTNQPSPPSTTSCSANLGIARGYAVSFLSGAAVAEGARALEYKGGGLPPSPVAGIVDLGNGVRVPFIVGGGKPGDTSPSSIEASRIVINPSGPRQRAYWNRRGSN